MMKYTNSIICALLLLMAVVSVDITPEAYSRLLNSSGDGSSDFYISDIHYT